MGAAAWVTSRGGDTGQVRPGAAVRDAGRKDRRGAAARAGGDAGRRGEVAMAGEMADRAGQHPPGSPRACRCATAQAMTVVGGLVLGLADPPPVSRLGQPLAAPVVPPPAAGRGRAQAG